MQALTIATASMFNDINVLNRFCQARPQQSTLPPISVDKQREKTGWRQTKRGKRVGTIKKRKHGGDKQRKDKVQGHAKREIRMVKTKKTEWGQTKGENRAGTNKERKQG